MAGQDNEASNFSLLPEGCTAKILSLTSPKDVCSLAAVSIGFKSASESDTVWEIFLPPDYRDLLAESDSPVIYNSLKELYFLLCDSPLFLHGGRQSFWLSKRSGKKCYMLGARGLHITWADTLMYWEWTSLPESRFPEVVELTSVCWLDIIGVMPSQKLSPETTYTAYLVYKLTEDHYGLNCSSNATIKFVEDSNTVEIERATNVYIVTPRRGQRSVPIRVSENRSDGWREIELGTFFNSTLHNNNIDVHMQLSETVELHWKKGMIVEGIEVRVNEVL